METREQYSIDQAITEWFQVELLDKTGRSHGFIGYRFNVAGAEAACNGWNADRDRGDLIAVIKPFEAPEAKPDELPPGVFVDPARGEEFAEAMRTQLRSCNGTRVTRIVMLDDPTAKLRGHNKLLARALGACRQAMANGSPSDHYRNRWLKARQLADDVLAEIALHTPFTG